MHGGLVVFDLDDIVSTEFFDHDVGRFFLVMHGVEGEGGSVHGRHLAQESLGGGDLVGFVGGSDLGNRLSALMIDRGHQVQGLGRFFVSAFEVVSAELKLPQDCRFESPLREFQPEPSRKFILGSLLFSSSDFLKAVLLFFLGRD